MDDGRRSHEARWLIAVVAVSTLAVLAGQARGESMSDEELKDLGTKYATAWSSQSAESLAAFYAEDGSLRVNEGDPAMGRDAITAKAQGFMTAFPDMVVRMDEISREGEHVVFRWTWTGTNTGPGGTGRAVRISGYEEWTLNPDGLIGESKGHYDEAEYQRQVGAGGDEE
jgi:steroid delta-isomerase-like uncharacterized protein